MAEMTKREGAQRILDAKASAEKLRFRIAMVCVAILAIGIVIGVLTLWHFGVATVLVCGLLLQYAVERMSTIIDASMAKGLKAMGWDQKTTIDEQSLEKIRRIAEG